MENSPAGLADLSHQLFLTPCILLKITFPHSLCLASVVTIMSQPFKGPCSELRSKEGHTQAGLKTLAHSATALGQVSPWEMLIHYPPELRSPSFVQAWLLVRCPYYQYFGSQRHGRDVWKPRNKGISALNVVQTPKGPVHSCLCQ